MSQVKSAESIPAEIRCFNAKKDGHSPKNMFDCRPYNIVMPYRRPTTMYWYVLIHGVGSGTMMGRSVRESVMTRN